MIVTCDACQTRFRIPDEKVTEKGVKVRCTKCQNTFRVSRPAESVRESPPAIAPAVAPLPPPVPGFGDPAPSAPAGAAAPFDPFAAFGPLSETPNDDATRPFTLTPGLMAQMGMAPPAQPAAPPTFEPPSFEPPAPATPPASFGADFGEDPFSEPTRVGPPPAAPSAAANFGGFGEDPFSESTRTAPLHAAPPPLPAAAPAHDPFALLDDGASPSASPFDGTQPAYPAGGSPFEGTQPAYPAGGSPFDGTQPGYPAQGSPYEGTQPAYPSGDAGFDGGGGQESSPFGELSSPGFGMPASFSDGGAASEGSPDSDRSLFGSYDPSSQSSTGTFPRPVMDRGMFDMPGAPAPAPSASELLGDVPPSYDDPGFGAEEVTATGVLPSAAPPASAAFGEAAPAAPKVAAAPASPAPAVEPASAETSAPRGSAFRSFGGVVANLFAAVLLLSGVAAVAGVYFNGGRLELSSLSPENLKLLWSRNGDVVPRDVSNGLYDTQSGHPVLYVRGEVENRTHGRGVVKVTAEIYDGDQLLRPASVYAGGSPTPEELAALAGQVDAEALVAKLDAQAKPVGPGERVPFLVPFYEYPTDLTGLRIKVVASPPEPSAAKAKTKAAAKPAAHADEGTARAESSPEAAEVSQSQTSAGSSPEAPSVGAKKHPGPAKSAAPANPAAPAP